MHTSSTLSNKTVAGAETPQQKSGGGGTYHKHHLLLRQQHRGNAAPRDPRNTYLPELILWRLYVNVNKLVFISQVTVILNVT